MLIPDVRIERDRCRKKGPEVVRLFPVAFALVLSWSVTSAAYACVVDVDCAVGSKCLKQAGQVYGICVGGMNPGNSNDR
jgi:hypothetical protein